MIGYQGKGVKTHNNPKSALLTISLRSVPKHDAAERRIFFTSFDSYFSQGVDINIVGRISGLRGCRGTDINLDLLVDRTFGPIIPLIKIPGFGILSKRGKRAIVVIYRHMLATFAIDTV